MFDRIHSTLTDNAYKNLANAIVNQAVDDVVEYLVCKQTRNSKKSMHELWIDADSADRFLHDESRLRVFTDLKPADMDKAILNRVSIRLNDAFNNDTYRSKRHI